MVVKDMLEVLEEFSPSMRLIMKAKGHATLETTVAETMCMLLRRPSDDPLTMFGLDSFLIREHVEDLDAPPGACPIKVWLEIDAR